MKQIRRLYEQDSSDVLLGLEGFHLLGQKDQNFNPNSDEIAHVDRSYKFLMNTLKKGEALAYGIHTGYGENVRNLKDSNLWQENQLDLHEFLQSGVGHPLPESVVRRALKIQAIKISKGLSGVHPQSFKDLVGLANSSQKMPDVPRKGSLGASGDLISMAHAIAPIFKKSKPRGPRDIIGMVNTNSMMASWSIEHHKRISQILELAYLNCALVTISGKMGAENYSSKGLIAAKIPREYVSAGKKVSNIRSSIFKKFGEIENNKYDILQPRYSVRCGPQILGNCEDLRFFAAEKILGETRAVADNPILLPRNDQNDLIEFWHGGLFYASGIATAGDCMVDILAKVAELLDRQTLILMDSRLNGGLPDNLFSKDLGHCKGIHMLISALCQEVRSLSLPTRMMSFSCEGNNQDLVPCGMTVLNNLDRLIETLNECTRAALFSSIRATYLRFEKKLPDYLDQKKWKTFRLESIEDFINLI